MLAGGERAEGKRVAAGVQQAGDDLGVQGGAAGATREIASVNSATLATRFLSR